MTQPLTCRVCGKLRSQNARAENAMCRSCCGKAQGRKRGKMYQFSMEHRKDKAQRKAPDSWWTKAGADYAGAARRMAGQRTGEGEP